MGTILRNYFEVGPVVQEMFYIVLIWSFRGHFVWWSGTSCAILVEGIKRNDSVKLF